MDNEGRQIRQLDEGINPLDYLIVLAKRKSLIIGITFGAALVAATISFTMSPVYRAETKILPPQQGGGMSSQLLSQQGGAAGLVGGTVGIKTSNDLQIGLLKSRPVLDNIIDRFDLMEIYKVKHREDARSGLAGSLKAQDDKKNGIITIGVEDKDPKLAAEMANAFVEELKNLNRQLAVTEASQRRLFFEEQMKDAKEALIKSEEALKGFQEKTGAVRIDEQARAVIEGIARLRTQISEKEVQLKVMKTYATSNNPDIRRVEEELKGLKEQLKGLETKGGGGNPGHFMPTDRIPSLNTEYVRKLREFKYNEALYEILLKQYEAARFDEAKEAVLLQVIEAAIPPEKKVGPKRRQMVMTATAAGFFISVLLAFFMEFIERSLSNQANKESMDNLRRYIAVKKIVMAMLFLPVAGNVFAQQIQAVPQTPLLTAPGPPSVPSMQGQAPAQNQPLQEINPTGFPSQQPAGARPSEFEQYISGNASPAVSTDIEQFGYTLFRQPPSTFAPVDKIPVGPDYVLGPGDELKIALWGTVEGQWSVAVDRDGKIGLPKIGILGVTGLTFMELKDLLYKEFSKYYTGFEMNVSMGALRSIRAYVVGNAERPGAYTVSSLSTLINALFEAGGPGKTGTMRDIQVKRNGGTIVHFDMYDFLLKGDKSKDVRLMPEDVIFIPTVGHLAGIAGNVKRPAIYELKGETRLSDLLGMSGGLTGVAFKGRVQIQRIEDSKFRTLFEGDLIDVEGDTEKNVVIRDGDLIKVFSVIETKNTLTISGAVANPGEYGVAPGVTRIKDIISLAGGLLYYAANQAELTRIHVTQSGPSIERISIDLPDAMKGDPGHNVPLEVNDYLFIRTVPDWQLYRTVTVSGEVRFPGTYTLAKGERLSSLIERAGGYTDKAYLKGAVFTRNSVRELQQKNLNDAVDRLEQQMLSQATVSAQTALSSEDAAQQKAVAEQQRAIIAKMRAAKAQGRMVIRLDEIERFKGSPYDIELEDGDTLTIPERHNSIQVIGSVYNPTAFVYDPREIISGYIDKAGGTTKYADDKEVFVLKSDGSAVARRQGGMFFMSSRLDPGDTVVVPEKVERIVWMREIKDLTQILYQIAVTAGVLIVAF